MWTQAVLQRGGYIFGTTCWIWSYDDISYTTLPFLMNVRNEFLWHFINLKGPNINLRQTLMESNWSCFPFHVYNIFLYYSWKKSILVVSTKISHLNQKSNEIKVFIRVMQLKIEVLMLYENFKMEAGLWESVHASIAFHTIPNETNQCPRAKTASVHRVSSWEALHHFQ